MKNIKLSIGKGLVIFGTIIGIHPFAVFLSLPLFGIGNYLIFNFSGYSRKRKFQWIIWPFIVVFSIWIIVLSVSEILQYFGYIE